MPQLRSHIKNTLVVRNADIAAVFVEIADLLEIEGENVFRVNAYRNAARSVQGLGVPVAEMIAKGEDLTELPGIGKDLAGKIREIAATGRCRALDELRTKTPSAVAALLKAQGSWPGSQARARDLSNAECADSRRAGARRARWAYS